MAQNVPRPALHAGIRRVALTPAKVSMNIQMPRPWRAVTSLISSTDPRRTGEAGLILSALGIAAWRLFRAHEIWLARELVGCAILSSIFACCPSPRFIKPRTSSFTATTLPKKSSQDRLPADGPLRSRRKSHSVSSNGRPELGGNVNFLWLTEGKHYRENMDDGVLTALLLGPLVAGAALFASLQQSEHSSSLPSEEHPLAWLIDSPLVLNPSVQPLDALVRSRRYLIQLTTLCSAALLVHLCTSRWTWRDGYTSKSEGTRTWYFIWFSTLVAGALFTLKRILRAFEIFVWTDLSTFDIVVILLFYQLSLYVMVRLGRRAFTLGELGAVGHGATAMFMETVYLTSAKIWPVTTLYVKTFRLPTPLLTFQLALIPGAFLTGFLLSPLLVLSRNIAQKPYRRLRLPHEKLFHQRALAAGFYVLAAAIVAVIVGSWTQWCLGGQNPWKWVVLYIFEGRRNWSRVALLGYWGLLGTISVGAWERQLAKARKYRQEGTASGAVDAGEKDASLLSVNGRRKFFHALAVMMFAPGIAFDPAFAHLSFSVAFSLFIFVEYVRYFALYPFGASVHLFMNEFLDEKDGGTVILSHFYLLTGCAGSVWLEGPSRILALTGVLVLGVGDSLASVVGKRHGRHRWSASTPKTIEGSVAFATCVLASAWLLSVFGLVESFSIPRYALAVGFGSVLEALSLQNDNLVLPFFTWSMLVLLRAVTGT